MSLKCRISGEETRQVMNLGELYLSDFLKPAESTENKFELNLFLSESSGLLQLEKGVPAEKMYGRYWYRSGTNQTMKQQLKNIVESCLYVKRKNPNGLWLDIACNDGTLLSYVPDNFQKIGIDPVEDSYLQESQRHANEIIQDYFSYEAYQSSRFKNKKCDIITCIAMFYDLEDPHKFLADVYKTLDDDGLFVVQMSYTPLMIKQLAFDNICHEHLMYYNLHSMDYLAKKNNFKIVDCELNDVNGGSFRLYLQKNIASSTSFANAPYRDVARFRLCSLMKYEEEIRVKDAKTYRDFFLSVKNLKNRTLNFIRGEKQKGKSIWVYGASTKGNTLLQYFNLDSSLIDAAAERSPYKLGLKTAGTNIPIKSEDEMRKVSPDYLLVLPWHFIDEFKERESNFLKEGGKFIVPCPEFKIISYEG